MASNLNCFFQSSYPYKKVLLMTVKLWDYFYPQVSLIVYLVHNENEDTTKLEDYQATMRKLVPRYA